MKKLNIETMDASNTGYDVHAPNVAGRIAKNILCNPDEKPVNDKMIDDLDVDNRCVN